MIGYFSRLLPVALKARFRASSSLVSRLPQRVSLRQIDLNRHMNQAQYPMVMELGRTDLLLGNDSLGRPRVSTQSLPSSTCATAASSSRGRSTSSTPDSLA
jgi:hypothetical protein